MIQFYADENFDWRIVRSLRSRGVDIVTALEDHYNETDDEIIFTHATEMGRVLLSQDEDMLRIAEKHQRNGISFAGLIYAHQRAITVGQAIDDLELIAQCETPDEYISRIQRLPLQSARSS